MAEPSQDESPDRIRQTWAYIAEKWGPENKCPMCGTTNPWVPLYVIDLAIRKDKSWGNDDELQVIPALPLLCSNCNFIAWIASKRAGLSEPPTTEGQS